MTGKLKFKGSWRSYQKRILDSLSIHLQDKKLHVVAAPGAGKTTLGIEVISRLNAPSVVLCPTNTIKNQWQQELSTVLSKMEGVGKCQVVVSVSEDEKNNYHPDGVVVVCEGAGDPAVKREIISVAQALFSVESHKIKIMNLRR